MQAVNAINRHASAARVQREGGVDQLAGVPAPYALTAAETLS
jgi:hypothetical protein